MQREFEKEGRERRELQPSSPRERERERCPVKRKGSQRKRMKSQVQIRAPTDFLSP
jgi:hypothetical protein